MSDPCRVYVEKMSEFSAFLREKGLTAGIGETEDACRVLTEIPLTERENVRMALRAVFAKAQSEQEIFDRCFDRFFVTEEQRRKMLEEDRKAAEEYARKKLEAEKELTYQGKPLPLEDDLKDVYIRMPEEARDRLRQVVDRFKGSMDLSPKLYESFIRSVFTRTLLEQKLAMEDAALHAEAFVSDELELLYREISEFKEEDIPRASNLIETISRQLNGELMAKHTRRGHHGKLDFKRTIRKGLETGGRFVRLQYRRKKARRQKILLLCDVSASMLQFSEFALQLIRSLAGISDTSRTFIFSEELREMDKFTLQTGTSFKEHVKASGIYGKGTNLAQALAQLLQLKPKVLDSYTMVILLSDAKTVKLENTETLLQEVKRNAGQVLWLNPIPLRKWEYNRTILRLSEICRMIPCSTLRELADACRKIAGSGL